MPFTILLIILSVLSSGAIYYFGFFSNELGTKWYAFVASFAALPILYLIWFAIFIILLFLISLFINKKKEVNKPNMFARFLVTQIVTQLNILSNTRLHKNGMSQIPNGHCLFVYNHTSRFDPMFIMQKMHRKGIICVTKPQNMDIPICGVFIHAAGYIPVNREDDKEGMKAILKSIDYIKKDYGSICISPEGTRSKTLELLPFRAGVFNIAKRAEVPIVMVGFKNTAMIHKNFPFKRTHVHMDILGVLDYDSIKELTTGEISSKVREYYVEYLEEGKENK